MNPQLRCRLLARGASAPPLFAPLIFVQAAEIEALEPREFLTNPNRLAKGLRQLHEALGTEAIVTCGADGLVAEAAGAELDWSGYPPTVRRPPASRARLLNGSVEEVFSHPRVEAAVEATHRLSSMRSPSWSPALVAALCGPATVAAQLTGSGLATADNASEAVEVLEAVGRITLELARRLLDAGVNVLVVVEETPPSAPVQSAWVSAITPLANVARFHQAAPVVTFADEGRLSAEELAAIVPPTLGVCFAGSNPVLPTGTPRLIGLALPPNPGTWLPREYPPPLQITAGMVPAEHGFAEARSACQRWQDGTVNR